MPYDDQDHQEFLIRIKNHTYTYQLTNQTVNTVYELQTSTETVKPNDRQNGLLAHALYEECTFLQSLL